MKLIRILRWSLVLVASTFGLVVAVAIGVQAMLMERRLCIWSVPTPTDAAWGMRYGCSGSPWWLLPGLLSLTGGLFGFFWVVLGAFAAPERRLSVAWVLFVILVIAFPFSLILGEVRSFFPRGTFESVSFFLPGIAVFGLGFLAVLIVRKVERKRGR